MGVRQFTGENALDLQDDDRMNGWKCGRNGPNVSLFLLLFPWRNIGRAASVSLPAAFPVPARARARRRDDDVRLRERAAAP